MSLKSRSNFEGHKRTYRIWTEKKVKDMEN